MSGNRSPRNLTSSPLRTTIEQQNNQGRLSRVKIVERAGRSVKNILAPNDPWGVTKCTDPDCFPCSTSVGSMKVSCRTPGVLYQIICKLCEAEGKRSVYIGQSGKNSYSRGRKHLEDYKAGSSSHCMSTHMKVHHSNVPIQVSNFRMVTLRSFHTPLGRQISEGLNGHSKVISHSSWETNK